MKALVKRSDDSHLVFIRPSSIKDAINNLESFYNDFSDEEDFRGVLIRDNHIELSFFPVFSSLSDIKYSDISLTLKY